VLNYESTPQLLPTSIALLTADDISVQLTGNGTQSRCVQHQQLCIQAKIVTQSTAQGEAQD
jgi:hypothetical protein